MITSLLYAYNYIEQYIIDVFLLQRIWAKFLTKKLKLYVIFRFYFCLKIANI
jgi:hypothetical protein